MAPKPMRACPYCQQQIQADNYTCPHCRRNLPTDAKGRLLNDDETAALSAQHAAGTHVCTNCGSRTNPTYHPAGSGLVTIVLLLLMILPGIIYEVWRRNASYYGCPKCGAKNPIPATSPAAVALLKAQQ